jgi:ribonuclease BN (tRNA processing enzyme)
LTHFSKRYPDIRRLVDEAAVIFPEVSGAVDLTRYPLSKAHVATKL